MNRFFREECYEEQQLGLNSTYVLYYNGELAAFCSVCADKLILADNEQEGMELPRGVVPAIKVARLGRSVKFKEFGFGSYMLDYVRYRAIQLSETDLGVRLITLDAYPHRVEYYISKGYVVNQKQHKKASTVSMRLDIFNPQKPNEVVTE